MDFVFCFYFCSTLNQFVVVLGPCFQIFGSLIIIFKNVARFSTTTSIFLKAGLPNN